MTSLHFDSVSTTDTQRTNLISNLCLARFYSNQESARITGKLNFRRSRRLPALVLCSDALNAFLSLLAFWPTGRQCGSHAEERGGD